VDNLVDQLIRDEDLRLKAYRDTVGKLTIGVGRNLDDRGISKEEAIFMLMNDIAKVRAELEAALPWIDKISPIRQAVLMNMAFNMGIGGLLQFRNTLKFIEQGNFAEASKGMLNSLWAKQVGQRAVRLSQQMLTDEWQ